MLNDNRMEDALFQNNINANTTKSMFAGSITWKNVPGLATTKKSRVAVMDCGILLSQLAALTTELKSRVKNNPLESATDAYRTILFIVHQVLSCEIIDDRIAGIVKKRQDSHPVPVQLKSHLFIR